MLDSDQNKNHVGTAATGCPAERSSTAGSTPVPGNPQRRTFLATSIAALAGLALWQWRKPRVLQAAARPEPKEVTIVQFDDSGKRLQTVRTTTIVKTEDEWRKQLAPN